MITVKEIYDNYPSADLLGIEVTDATVPADIEDCGDTLFVFLCRELCEEDVDLATAQQRCASAIQDISSVRHGLLREDNPEPVAADQRGNQDG